MTLSSIIGVFELYDGGRLETGFDEGGNVAVAADDHGDGERAKTLDVNDENVAHGPEAEQTGAGQVFSNVTSIWVLGQETKGLDQFARDLTRHSWAGSFVEIVA